MTSVIPTCSNDSAAVEVVTRSHDDIWSEDGQHASLLIRIDYICVGNDSQQVRDKLIFRYGWWLEEFIIDVA